MKKVLLLFLILSFLTIPLFAQKKTDVLLKFSKQEGVMRIVVEAEETFINNAKVAPSPSQIKIEFQEPFNLNLPVRKDLPFEVKLAEKSLTVNLKEKSDIKSMKLSSPARLVFDIRKKEILAENPEEKQPVAIMSKVFVIDAGHGGYDFGITAGDASEKEISLSLAKDLSLLISKKGKKVFPTRKVDQHVSLADRINLINQKRPDIFISLHSSLSENFILYSPKFEEQGSNEIIDFYSISSKQRKYIEKSKMLSESIGKALKEEFNVDIIRREMPLPLLNSAGAPAVLIEFPSPRFIMYDRQMKERLEDSILKGVALFEQ